jgi:hypothetical protein
MHGTHGQLHPDGVVVVGTDTVVPGGGGGVILPLPSPQSGHHGVHSLYNTGRFSINQGMATLNCLKSITNLKTGCLAQLQIGCHDLSNQKVHLGGNSNGLKTVPHAHGLAIAAHVPTTVPGAHCQ